MKTTFCSMLFVVVLSGTSTAQTPTVIANGLTAANLEVGIVNGAPVLIEEGTTGTLATIDQISTFGNYINAYRGTQTELTDNFVVGAVTIEIRWHLDHAISTGPNQI